LVCNNKLCPLFEDLNSLYVNDYGNTNTVDWLIVGESPGEEERKLKKVFVGPTGKVFRSWLEKALDVYENKFGYRPTYYITNCVSCYTTDVDSHIPYCSERLWSLIDTIKPKRIFAFGAKALHTFTGEKLSITNLFGAYTIHEYGGTQYTIEYFMHPTNLLRNKALIPYWERLSMYRVLNPPNNSWLHWEACGVVYIDNVYKAIDILKGIRKKANKPNFYGKYLIGYDTEFNSDSDRALCVSLCWGANNAVAFPEDVFKNVNFLKELENLFLDDNIVVCAHSWKADAKITEQLGLKRSVFTKKPFIDSMILRSIFNPELRNDLATCEYMVGMGGHKEVFHSKLKNKRGSGYEKAYDDNPRFTMWYCALDTIATYRLVILYYDMLKKFGLLSTYEDLYHKLGAVLYDIESIGMQVDTSVHSSLKSYLNDNIKKQEDIILANTTVQKVAKNSDKIKDGIFNIASSYHMRELLFDNENGFKKKIAKKTDKGSASTDKYVVQSFKGKIDIVDNILEHSRLSTLYNTYVKGWEKRWDSTYKLHTFYRIVRTGRLSSSNPNLQNLPRPANEESKLLRSCLTSPLPFLKILEVDFGQAELRQMAQESGDEELIKAYLERVDIHKKTAAFISGIPIEKVSKEQRQSGKPANFGLAFGMSEYRLQEYALQDYGVELTLEEAKETKKRYFQLYKGVRRYQIRTILEASKAGCVWVNWCGEPIRVRWLPDIGLSNRTKKGGAERQAINTKIQGGAQEYTLRGMVSSHNLLVNNKLPGVAAIIGTVHDSILFLVHEDMIEEACKAIGYVLVTQPTIRDVPLEVDFKVGDSLGDMKEGITINSLDNPKYPEAPKSHYIYGQYDL